MTSKNEKLSFEISKKPKNNFFRHCVSSYSSIMSSISTTGDQNNKTKRPKLEPIEVECE